MLVINVSVMLILIFTLTAIPYISVREIAFGIRIPRNEFDKKPVKTVRKKFLRLMLIIGLISTAIVAFFAENVIIVSSIYLAYLIVATFIFLSCRRKMIDIKENSQWVREEKHTIVVDTDFRKKKLTVSNAFYLFNVLLFASSLVVLLINKIEFNTEVYLILFLEAFIISVFMLVNVLINKNRVNFSEKNTDNEISKEMEKKSILSLSMYLMGIVVQMTLIISMISSVGLYDGTVMIIGLIVLLFVIIIYLVVKFIALERNDKSHSNEIVGEDDRLWKLGVIYYNKKDPAVFVKKRMGIGYTLNHARITAYLFYLAIIVFIVGIVLISI